jgi:DNA/RNA endonuclease G (NUC1)
LVAVCLAQTAYAGRSSKYRPIVPAPGYNHAKYIPLPDKKDPSADFAKEFRAFVTVFDRSDDDDGDTKSDRLGIPHYVAYELRALSGKQEKGAKRPSPWITEPELAKRKVAPFDDTYAYSSAFRQAHDNWYVRGHLCMKQHAGRLGKNAEWNTHTVLNAVPQRANFNGGIWRDLEDKTAHWADTFGTVWIITGRIFYSNSFGNIKRIGEPSKNEMQIAVPDALFKIVVRETDANLKTLAFIYDQDVAKRTGDQPYDHKPHAVSINQIEKLTGFDFVLPDADNPAIESKVNRTLW